MSKLLAVLALSVAFVAVGCKASGEVDTKSDAKKMSTSGEKCSGSSCDKAK